MTSIGIAISSGSLKGVFAHGVLAGLEQGGVKADIYGGVSSSTLSVGLAAAGRSVEVGADYWLDARHRIEEFEGDMSRVVHHTILTYGPMIKEAIFAPGAPKIGVLVTHVATQEASQITQTEEARRFGRKLLIKLSRGDTTWVSQHTARHMYWSDSTSPHNLTAANFDEVVYASTRMLHAWPEPAWIGPDAYIDGSYSNLIPDVDVQQKCDLLVAIGCETESIQRTFAGHPMQPSKRTILVKPDRPLEDFGVGFQSATADGLQDAFNHGLGKGQALVEHVHNEYVSSPDH